MSASQAIVSADLVEVFVRLRPEDIAYVKFIFESYETVGFLRTIDPGGPEGGPAPRPATLVLMLVPDFAEVGQRLIDALAGEIALERIPPPEDLGEDWLVASVHEAEE